MTKSYLLGIDIGTSACKVAVFDRNGQVLAAANGDYPVYYPQEGWAEQNPEEWWSAVCKATKETIQKAGIAPEEIAGVGIDGQSWSAIAIDKEGKVLTNTPIWMDTRAQSICDRLNEEIGADKIFEVAGNSLLDAKPESVTDFRLSEPVRIGVAEDEAFCFFYADNFRLLGECK